MCGKNGRFELTNYQALAGLNIAFHPSSIVVRRCGSCRTRSRSARRRWRRVKRTTNSLSSTSPTTTQGKIYAPKQSLHFHINMCGRYQEDMTDVFERCQRKEAQRLQTIKDTMFSIHKCLNIAEDPTWVFFYNKTTNSHNRSRLTVLGLSTRPTWM